MIRQHRRLQLGRKEVESLDKSAQNLSDQTVIPIVVMADIIKEYIKSNLLLHCLSQFGNFSLSLD